MNLIGNAVAVIEQLNMYSEMLLNNLGIWGALVSCLLIVLESIIPILPLCVFVTFIFYTFGPILGFIISWLCTVGGCMLSFLLFRTKIKGWFTKHIMQKKNEVIVTKIMNAINNISLSGLAILVAIPFTPAFAVNIAGGLSNISVKKYFVGILIGKTFMVYFWGYIGTTLLESLTHPVYLAKILVMLFLAYIISKIVNKHFSLD